VGKVGTVGVRVDPQAGIAVAQLTGDPQTAGFGQTMMSLLKAQPYIREKKIDERK
jgi:hypothetical protein